MVQGGYNAALNPADSVEAHFLDTLKGGQWINDQELAWTLVNLAPQRILELENRYGCFFDRTPDGRIAFLIGDISGKGLDAAFMMVRVASLLRWYGKEGTATGQWLTQTNTGVLTRHHLEGRKSTA